MCKPRRSPLFIAVLCALSSFAIAEEGTEEKERLDRMIVRASPLALPADEIVQPASILDGDALVESRAGTLGETVSGIAGVHSGWFGPGVGRPIIRGQEGGRVGVLTGNLPVLDASTTAADHAVAVEPLLAERVEVLKGPSTLLYGSGAAGGLVQILDGRIAEAPKPGFSAAAELRGDRVADLFAGVVKLGLGSERSVFRVDAFRRETQDYRVPRGALHEHGDHDALKNGGHDDDRRRVENSATEVRGVGAGITWFGDGAELGLAVGRHLSLYGVPGHAHEEHEDHLPFAWRWPKNGDAHEHQVRLDLAQTRYETRLGLDRPLGFLARADWRLAYGDYRHQELEEHDGEVEIGTRFDIEGWDSRIDLQHEPFGDWRGVFGWQWGERRLSALGEEAFVPPYRQSQWGLFLLERFEAEPFALELGARYEQQRVRDRRSGERIRHRPLSLSFGARYALSEGWHLNVSLARYQRAPLPEELLSDGPHAATRAYEIGDPELKRETGRHLELGLHWHGERLEAKGSLFHTDFDDFIYLADTGDFQDGLPVRVWTQAGARFTGFELEGGWLIGEGELGQLRLIGMADAVRARLKQGGWLPRIAPYRQALGLNWQAGAWSASLRGTRYAKQDKVAAGEEETEGFTLLDADLGWRFGPEGRYRLGIAGRNLSDRIARWHVSYLKEDAPLPGRDLLLSLRAEF
ncbi:MAG: ligand-gated channel [Lysobacterales bacterium]|jgi:iron complex outermembrane receptor protein|nr:MAG: ligand-gated channel [Xanthomonadales bacterium]